MARAFLGLGSNLGDKVAHLREALHLFESDAQTRVIRKSSLYTTAPVGYLEQDDFVNGVLEVETGRAPEALLALCQDVEQALRRVRRIRWGPRTIDVDILVYDDLIREDPLLTLPHPRMLERGFVLVPLAEIAPELVVEGAAVATWLSGLEPREVEEIRQLTEVW